MTSSYFVRLVGVAFMAWGGAAVNTQMEVTGWRGADLAIFAIGILIIAQSYVGQLEARIAKLESELRGARVPAA